jgi:hypothetical protein
MEAVMKTTTMIANFGVAFGAAVAMLATPGSAMAQGGLFDALDPCIAAGETVSQERSRMLAELRAGIARAEGMKPTPEYVKLWWIEKRKALRPYFDAKVLPRLPAGLTTEQKNGAFKLWLEQVVAADGGWAKVDTLIVADWNRMRDQQIADARSSVEGGLDQLDRDLRSQCPADFGNQLLRGTLTLTMAPINQATRNLEIAGREGTLLGKIVAAPTGISVTDVVKNGPAGGENSELRKAVKAIQPAVDVIKAPINILVAPFKIQL